MRSCARKKVPFSRGLARILGHFDGKGFRNNGKNVEKYYAKRDILFSNSP